MENGKCVLLDSASLEAVRFTTNDPTRYQIQGLNVLPDRVEATDGHIAIRVPHGTMGAEDFPVVPGDDSKPIPDGGVIVPLDALDRAAKGRIRRPTIPVLGTVKIGSDGNGGAVAVATDLSAGVVARGKVDGRFPDIAKVLPSREDRSIRVTLNAHLLKRIAEFAIKANPSQRAAVEVGFWFAPDGTASGGAQRFEIPIYEDAGRIAVGAIMPMAPSTEPK